MSPGIDSLSDPHFDPCNERIHHIGFVVAAIGPVITSFAAATKGTGYSQITHDPVQRVRVAFIYASHPGDPSIELVEPTDASSPVAHFLERGGGLHHICQEVVSLDEIVRSARTRGLVLVSRPQSAVAFGGRRIAWFLSREKLLIEFLEKDIRP